MKNILKRISRFPYWWSLPFIGIAAILLGMSSRSPMWMDEYEFYRLSSEIPNYNSTSNWFFVDRPSTLALTVNWKGIDRREAFALVYDTPIYSHSPLVPILLSPIVKGLNFLADKGIIPHIEAQPGLVKGQTNHAETMTIILRIIPIFFTIWTLYLIYKMMEKKVGKLYAYTMWIPVVVGLFILEGSMLFYWDVFMMFFLVATLYIQEMHPNSKWKYVTACCLVNTKMFLGIAFLLPIFIKAFKDDWRTSWKMLLPALSIIPFYIITVLVTHQPLYLWTHYEAQIPIHNFIYTLNDLGSYFNIFMTMGMPLFLAILVLLCLKPIKYAEYIAFLAMGIFYEWGMGLSITYLPAMLCSAALAMPLVVKEFNLIERGIKWMGLENEPIS